MNNSCHYQKDISIDRPDNQELEEYFSFRNVAPDFYADFVLPEYLLHELPTDHNSAFLDIGCGFGQILKGLRAQGFKNLHGIDVSPEAVKVCSEQGLNVEKIHSIHDYCKKNDKKYDFIIMSHVIEHLARHEIVETLRIIRAQLLNKGGRIMIMTPNAQSNTGCYWAFEDFTHTTMFTAGSLYYVLKCAGFDHVCFVDPLGVAGSRPMVKILKRILISLYVAQLNFCNWVTNSSYHRQSPQIFTFELKVVAS